MSHAGKRVLHGETLTALLDLREHLTEEEMVTACREFATFKIMEASFRKLEKHVGRDRAFRVAAQHARETLNRRTRRSHKPDISECCL